MKATPVFWVALIFTLVVLTVFAGYAWRRLYADGGLHNDVFDSVVQNGLIMLTAIGAFWTLWATAQGTEAAWMAYRESVKPNALFQVVQAPPKNGEPVSVIVYQNNSRRDMEKLNPIVKVFTDNDEADMSGLFAKDMLLTSGDSRNRKLLPYTDPKNEGFDLKAKVNAGEKVMMTIGYSHVHDGRREVLRVQQTYIWDDNNALWDIHY